MVLWTIVGGPREYHDDRDPTMIDVGWAWMIDRDGDTRTVRVEVARGESDVQSLPHKCSRAIETRGRSVVTATLNRVNPPERFVVGRDAVHQQPPRH